MDIQKIVSQLINFLGQNPQLIGQFLNHPYSTTQQATGASSQLSSNDMGQVLTALAGLSSGQQVDYGNLASLASQLMGSNGNSAHALANTLFGGSQAQAQVSQAAQSNSSIDLGTLVSLAGMASQLFGSMGAASSNAGNAANSPKPTSPKPTSPKPTAAKPTSSSKPTAAKPTASSSVSAAVKPHKRENATSAAAASVTAAKPTSSKPTSSTKPTGAKPTASSSSAGKIDLSDGIDMNEAVTLASQLFGFGGKN